MESLRDSNIKADATVLLDNINLRIDSVDILKHKIGRAHV